MNAGVYSEWLRRQGQTVIRTQSSYWHCERLGVYQAFPYHWTIAPGPDELSELFTRHRAVALRYSMPAECAQGCVSYLIAYEGERYNLENLGHRTRKNVRRGLRECTVEKISMQLLADEAWEIRSDTLDRQRRDLKVTRDSWRARYLAASDLKGFQAWGARVRGTMAAYLVTFQMEDCLCIIDHQSHRDYLDLNVNNALTFVVTEQGVTIPGVRLLSYGLESLDAPERVSEFKFHMGYTRKPIRQQILFAPRFSPLINRFTHGLTKAFVRLRPANRQLAKAEGMLRVGLACRPSAHSDSPLAAKG